MIFALIFVAAGTFQILEEPYYESQNSRLEFHEAIYFVFVTISTVGASSSVSISLSLVTKLIIFVHRLRRYLSKDHWR